MNSCSERENIREAEACRMARWDYIRVIFFALLSICIGIALYCHGVLGISTDDFMRICLAAQWADRPRLVQFGNWPPLFSVVYGSVIRAIPFPLEVGHVLTAILSGVVVFLCATFSGIVFRSASIAILTAVLIIVNPLHLALAASMLSEPLYTVLFMAFILCTWKWSFDRQDRWLLGGTLFAILMTMLRTDGTPIALTFGLWVIWSRRTWKSVIIFLCLSAFPLLWLSILWKEFASLPVLLKLYSEDVRQFYASVPYWNWIPIFSLLKFYSFGLISVGFVLVFWKHIERNARTVVVIAMACTASQLYLLWNRVSTVFPERTVYSLGVQFTIIEAFGIYTLWKQKPRIRLLLIFACVLQLGSNLYVGSQMKVSYSQEMVHVGRILSSSASLTSKIGNQHIATDLEDGRYGVVSVLSGVPGRFTRFQFDPTSKQFSVKDPEPTPKYFLVASEEAAQQIHVAWRKSNEVKLHSLWFISDDSEVLSELRDIRSMIETKD